ncbi:GNAT family N-acetyltransferase [uncultured Anaerococcus sp.]|uniref:GNAT family N-acetyltransferase n=1 Tax=uncultured Anaerococcus sp. TaxID=293428 RepID=UPI0025FBA2D5|nr:GNAT family N-acetyltransferase [uncultured Anaerococcus sp.]
MFSHNNSYWQKWYKLYFSNPGEYFYAYIYDQNLKVFVGDVNFHPSKLNPNTRDIGIVIKDKFRGKGYGKAGLKLLIDKAFSFDIIKALYNNFEKERTPALKIHEKLGFKIVDESDGILYLDLENK